MPTPIILVDGVQPPPLGSKTNGTKTDGSSPTLSLASTLGIETVEWRLSKPSASAAVLADARPSAPFSTTVGPLAAFESYIVTCIANDDPEQIAECEIAVPSPVHGLRVPRFGETQQWDPTDGWEGDLRALAQALESMASGSILPAPPPSSHWTAYHVSTAAISDVATGIATTAPSTAGAFNLQGYERTAGAGFDLKFKIAYNLTATDWSTFGVYVRDAAGKITTFEVGHYGASINLVIAHVPSPTGSETSASSRAIGSSQVGTLYLRIQDTGGNHVFSISADGAQWVNIYTEVDTANIGTPVAAGIFTNTYNAAAAGVLIGCSGL